jgi:hypothetical protein
LLGAIQTILSKISPKAVATCAALAVLVGPWADRPALAWAPDTTIWTKPLAVMGFGGAYASMVKLGSRVMMYSNHSKAAGSKPCPGASCPGIVLYMGNSTTSVTQNAVVAPNSMINDVFGPDGVKLAPQRMFTRVSVVRSEQNGTFYAIAHVADTNPPGPGGVYPALLTSPNGISWAYHGKIKGEPWNLYGPGIGRAWANSMAFIVNDEAAGALDLANPLANRFLLYSDGYGNPSSLSLLYSADGTTWYFARTASGAIRDFRPPELMGEQPIFASAVKTPHGYHMITPEGLAGHGAAAPLLLRRSGLDPARQAQQQGCYLPQARRQEHQPLLRRAKRPGSGAGELSRRQLLREEARELPAYAGSMPLSPARAAGTGRPCPIPRPCRPAPLNLRRRYTRA